MTDESPVSLRTIDVAIADDHPMMRAGLREMLTAEASIRIVGEAETGPEALRLARERQPTVLVLDLDLPDMTGVEVARALRDEASPVRILAFTAHTSRGFVEGLVDAGVAGYVTKDKPPAVIVEAVLAIARGEGRWFVVPSAPNHALGRLSTREREVLDALADGLSNAEIGARLSISESTVRNNLTRIYETLGVASAREAIVWAIEHLRRPEAGA